MTLAAVRPKAAASSLRLYRLLRLELRHNAMAWLLPVLIVLFWLTTYRKDMAMPPLWNLRAAGLQSGVVPAFAAPVTGAAAWMASREARRRVRDQVGVTPSPRGLRLFAVWAATTLWAVGAYLGCVAVLYAVTARQATWGGPLWWPVAVAGASLPAFAALGFAAGTVAPSRFTAPLAAVGGFLLLALPSELIHGSHSAWQISPLVTGPWNLGPQADVATFYPFAPDLSIAQVMFLAALTVALLLGVLLLPREAATSAVRACAALLVALSLLTAGSAVALAGTGTLGAHGMIDIPALHDSASDRPLRFTPVCSRTAIPVCLNPAYADYLPATADALAPLLNQLAGLPGAPTRIQQANLTFQQEGGDGITVRTERSGSTAPGTSHLILPVQQPGPVLTPRQTADQLMATFGPDLVGRVTGYGPDATDAQNAVATALFLDAGLPGPPSPQGLRDPDASASPPSSAVLLAARRFAALPGPVRHAWLLRQAAALRAGRLTLAQLP